jgi:predicted RNA binding protein YcfA (HicA-like mRNA interferase family)
MGERIRQMSSTEVERILRRYGFVLISQKGSHRKWRNEAENRQVVVPMHKGKNLSLGILRNILITADIPTEEWKTEN